MYSVFRQTCERLLRIPHDPAPPPGDEASARVFRAAPAFFKYLLVLWGIGAAFFLLFGVAILGGINFALIMDKHVPGVVRVIVFTVSVLVFLLILTHLLFSLAVLRLNYEKRWYVVTDRSLRVREGVVTVREMTVTFANIQNVAVLQGPIQRVLGLADLQVETAGGGAAHANQKQVGRNLHVAWFRGIDNAEEVKTLIQDRLRKLKDAGLGDRDDHAPAAAAPAANVTTALPFAELAAALGAGSDFLTLTGLALGKGVKFDGGAGNDRLDVNDTVIDGALTFLGGADDDHFNTGGARFHAGKVLVDLGVGNNDLGPAATNSTVAGDFTVKAGAGDDGFFITSPQFRVGGSLSFNGGGGNDSVSIASTYVGVDRSLIITLGAHTVQLANNINTPTLSVGGDLLITTGSGAETDFTFTNNTDLAIGGKTVLKGGDSIDKFNFTYARGTFLGGVTAALGGDTNTLNFTASAATFFGSLKYSGGGGADTLSFTTSPDVTVAGAIDAKLGDGTNDVQLAPSSRLTVGGGVKIGAGTGNETINLGSATLEVRKGIALAVGAGNATVNVTGSSSGHVSGAISFAGGTATTDTENISLTFGNALFTGGVSLKSGGGAFTNNVTVSGTLAITGDYRVAAVGEGVKAINFSSAQLRLGGALDLKGGSDGSNFNLAPGPYVIGKVKLQGGAGTDVFKLIGDGQVAGLVDVQLGGGGNQIDVTGNNGTVLSGGLKILSTSAAGENEVVNLTSVILPGALNIKLAAGFGTVKLDDITAAATVTIDTGAGIDTVTFESVNAGTKSVYRGPVKILLGTGADTVNLGLAAMANALVELQAPMFIDGGGDADFDAINQNNVTLVGAGSITPVNFP